MFKFRSISFVYRSLAALIFVFLMPLSVNATLMCASLFTRVDTQPPAVTGILGDLRSHVNKPVVRQCGGTCFLESFASVIGAELTRFEGTQIRVSRVHLYASYLKFFLRNYTTMKPQGALPSDFISGGSIRDLKSFLKGPSSNFTFTRDVSQWRAQIEDRLVQEYQREVIIMIRRLVEEKNPHSLEIENALSLLSDADVSVINQKIDLIKDKYAAQLPFTVIEDLDFKRFFDIIKLDYVDSFDLLRRSESSKRLNRAVEDAIIKRLSIGGEIILSYEHFFEFHRSIDGRNGFLEFREDIPLPSNSQANGHLVVVTDIIKDEIGRIKYFVVRNSWGQRTDITDRGYNYISVEYLLKVGEMGLAVFNDRKRS